MRRWIITAAVLLGAASLSFAQERVSKGDWEIQAGISYCALDRIPYINAEISGARESYSYSTGSGYSESVSDEGGTVFPTISLTGGYSFPDSRLGVFMNVYVNYAYNTLTGGPAPLYERESIWHFAPELRFYYLKKEDLRMYASVGPSIRWRHFSETLEGDTLHEHDVSVTAQIAPFSVSFGDKWIFSFDVGSGGVWSLIKINAGYRF